MAEFKVEEYDYTQCRDEGHTWLPSRQFQNPGKSSGKVIHHLVRRRECAICGVSKDQFFRINTLIGGVYKDGNPVYTYPDGYRLRGVNHFEVSEACRFVRLMEGL